MKGNRQAQEAILAAITESWSVMYDEGCEQGIYRYTGHQNEPLEYASIHADVDLEVIESYLLENGWSFSGN